MLRNGVIITIGKLLSAAFNDEHAQKLKDLQNYQEQQSADESDEEEKKEKNTKSLNNGVNEGLVESLWDILKQRFHDVSSYTRSKVLQTWTHLCEYVLAVPLFFNNF